MGDVDQTNKDIQAALEAVEAGRLDALSPELIAQLEAHLNADAEAAARLADCPAAPQPAWQTTVEPPPPEAWERVWQRIDAAATPARPAVPLPRILRLWRPLVAAAACVALVLGVWRLTAVGAPPDWPVEWVHDVEINDLEVYEGGTPFVLAAGGDQSISVIWVLETEG